MGGIARTGLARWTGFAGLVVLALALVPASQTGAQAQEPPAQVLFYGPTAGGPGMNTPGIEATVWSEQEWQAASFADFHAFDAIVFGDQPICFGSPSIWDTAVANRSVWSGAVTGNVLVAGTDPDWHGKTQFTQQAISFAAADPDEGPGLYVALSCAYHGSGVERVELLQSLGTFEVQGVQNCPSDAHKISAHPALDGLSDEYLSNWGCSAHDVFASWPADYQPLVIIRDATPSPPLDPYTAADGTSGHVYMVARGAAAICPDEGDTDGDCLLDTTEENIGTDPTNPDTDDDGLIDSWEVDPSVQGAGVHLPSGEAVHRDAVFGPYNHFTQLPAFPLTTWPFCSGGADDELRLPAQYRCLNAPPDPLHKDIFLELDWQDCTVSSACPEVIFDSDDTLHHAPSIRGLADIVRHFGSAPVTNPDDAAGINLRILVDQAIEHVPNCDQGSSFARNEYFGTPAQRRSRATLEAKELAVRYVWSGHSSAEANHAACPDPGRLDFLLQGLGEAPLASYDWSPFGSANISGRDILVTMGPVWNCPSAIGVQSLISIGFNGPCYREFNIGDPDLPEGGLIPPLDPGIFPAEIPVGGVNKAITWPISRLIGTTEAEASRQLWARSLTHLLGHSVGLGAGDVHNHPSPAGRHQIAENVPLTALRPDDYEDWTALELAIAGVGIAHTDAMPNYDELARTDLDLSDPDNDDVMEHEDNCPGVFNPGQENSDFGPWWAQLFGGRNPNIFEFGDACDPDIDGDEVEAPEPGAGEFAAASFAPLESPQDPFPYDTDNDGFDNDVDHDDDDDGVPDVDDNCALHANADQADLDDDGYGDVCDIDVDGDGAANMVEGVTGSGHLDADSTPEYVGSGNSCADGTDNDLDGLTDEDDAGCADSDGDSVADADDSCPGVYNPASADRDGDGIGDACDLVAKIVWVSDPVLLDGAAGSEVGYTSSRAGAVDLRLGEGCDGALIAQSSYDPGPGQPQPAFAFVERELLVEGYNPVTVCVSDGQESATATTWLLIDTTVPETILVSAPIGETTSPVLIELDSDDTVFGFRCSINGEEDACGRQTRLDLDPGTYTFTAAAVDAAGNEDPTPVEATFTVIPRTTSPLKFVGLEPPLGDPPAMTSARAGGALPITFVVDGSGETPAVADDGVASVQVECGDPDGPTLDAPQVIDTPGNSDLHYEPSSGRHHVVWKTDAAWKGTCRRLEITLTDGTVHQVWISFT